MTRKRRGAVTEHSGPDELISAVEAARHAQAQNADLYAFAVTYLRGRDAHALEAIADELAEARAALGYRCGTGEPPHRRAPHLVSVFAEIVPDQRWTW